MLAAVLIRRSGACRILPLPALLSLVVLIAGALCAGCGSGGGDNGQVLRALGFFQEVGDPPNENPPTAMSNAPDSGRSAQLSTTLQIPNDPDDDGDMDGGFIGLENAQTNENITTDGAVLTYAITNSNFAIPSQSEAFSVLLPPMSGTTANPVFSQLILVPQGLMTSLRTERGVPPPPFTLIITVTVQAIDQSGSTFQSNSLNYQVMFTD